MTQIEDVLAVVNRYFSDTSRPAEETLEGLEYLAEELESRIESLGYQIEENADG